MADPRLEILVPEAELRARVAELGAQISADYEGRDLVLVCLLKGALFFCADLARAVALPLRLEFLRAASYGAGTTSSGSVRIGELDPAAFAGRDVLVVEDIVDSGLTLARILEAIRGTGPRSLGVCCLLHKERERSHAVPLRYVGFRIPDRFVVGYGLDHGERYRNLPHVAVLAPDGAPERG
ncbi:MAG TPA: hypoxanthine phosphoribosyltransferase [Gemmatimonadota bacterium]